MKPNLKFLVVCAIMMTSCLILPRQTEAQQSNVSFQLFYDELSPYGEWVDYSSYGYVWIPDAGSDFTPYSSNGRWVSTDYGWAWASDYNWGWATFHYGRWDFNDSFGWFWVPDNEWGPAWVNWREADGYYGWEPMQPGISLSIGFGRQYSSNSDHWMFVRDRDIEQSNLHDYYVSGNDRNRIARNSNVIRNTFTDNNRHTTYVTGPSRNDFQRSTGRTVVPVVIRENSTPGSKMNNGQLQIYRPQVVKNNDTNRKPAPVRVTNAGDVKRTPTRNETNQNQIGNPATQPVRQPNVVRPQNDNQPSQQRNVTQPVIRQPEQQNVNQPPVNRQPEKRQPVQVNTERRQDQPQRVNPNQGDNNANRPVRQPAMNQPQNNTQPVQQQPNVNRQDNPQVQPERTVAPATPDRNIQQTRTPEQNQPNANQVKQNQPVKQQGKKPATRSAKTKQNEQRDK